MEKEFGLKKFTTLPIKTKKPWGYELLWALTPYYAGKILHIDKGHRLSLQYHKKKDETLYVLEGLIQITMGTIDVIVHRGSQPVRFKAGEIHRIKALKDSTILEVSTPELDDVVRIADDYGRIPIKP